MDCMTVARVVDSWEKGRFLDIRELEDAQAHAALCPDCRARFGPLLELAARGFPEARSASAPSAAATRLADRVMEDIGRPSAGIPAIGRPAIRRFRVGAFPLAAAAACVVFVFLGVFVLQDRAGSMVVRFALDAPEASSVQLAGSFSGWNSEGLRLKKTDAGVWVIDIRLRRGRSYTYNFLVDGESWVVDPAATDRIEDDFGGESALIRL